MEAIRLPAPASWQPAREWLSSPYTRRTALRVAYQYGLGVDDASDLFQELCLALLNAGPDARINATWLFQTSMHKAADIWRERRKPARLAPSERSRSTDREELFHLLRAHVDRLPARLREFYALRFEQGFSQRETARRLGVRRSVVRSIEKECLDRVTRLRHHTVGASRRVQRGRTSIRPAAPTAR